VTDENLEKTIRAALAAEAAEVEPAGTLAGLRARIARGQQTRSDPMTHACPARLCPRDVPDHLLMCGIHWHMVPPPMQRAVNAAYDHGDGLGSAALRSAQMTAIRAVNNAIGDTADAD
jgi:hypothetical protein